MMSPMLGQPQAAQSHTTGVVARDRMHALVAVVSQTRCMQTANVSDEMHAMGKSSPAILPAYGNLRLMSLVRTLVVRDVVC